MVKLTYDEATHDGYAKAFLVVLLCMAAFILIGNAFINGQVASCTDEECNMEGHGHEVDGYVDVNKFDYDNDGEIDSEYLKAFGERDVSQIQVAEEKWDEVIESADEAMEMLEEE